MIPKIIHYCWFGKNPMSELGERCIESWRKFCPDYEIKMWNEDNIDLNSVDYMREAYEAKVWGFVPDVARLQIIYENGGIYLDTDVEIVKPLDELLENEAFFGEEDDSSVNLGQGFGAEKGNHLIKKLLDDYTQRHFLLENGECDRTTSPTIQTALLTQLGYVPSKRIQTIEGAKIYPSEYFCPMSFSSGTVKRTDNTFSIHHFEGTWCTDEEKKKVAKYREIRQRYGLLGRAAVAAYFFKEVMKQDGLLKALQWFWTTVFRKIKYLFIR